MQDQAGELLYTQLAEWWPLLSAPAEYADEAGYYAQALAAATDGPPRRVLELGAGGGNNALHMKAHFELTLVDRAPAMLAVSARLNPDCEHLEGDMRTLRLPRRFDAVFIHDAIAYMASHEDLTAALATAYRHCRPGGGLLVVPDVVRETFMPRTEHGGHDGEGRALRYLEWVWDPDPADCSYAIDFAYLLREGDVTRSLHDRHRCGLFARRDWLKALAQVGFAEARALEVPIPDYEKHLAFAARRPR